MTKTTRKTIYQQVTDQIVSAIEAGAGEWHMPWHNTGSDLVCPINATSRRPYRGINVLSLWASAEARGFPTGQWATYRQWRDMGAQVRKGEQSTLVVFWKVTSESDADEDNTQADDRRERRFSARGYRVFNAAQVDGFTPPEVPALPTAERIAHAESFFAGLGAEIRHGGGRAYYRPKDDYIQLPPFEAFRDAVAYYATLAHESTHWTGHGSRMDRDLSGRFGDEAYAAEELIAELGAAFLCAQLGLANEPRPDHAAYLSSWLRVLRSDERAIFTAASQAQAAVDWMEEQQAHADDAVLHGAAA